MARIIGHEYPISKIFSPEFDFVIPVYQRPYAWTTEEAGDLFDDIQGFMQQQTATESDDPYFLGSIVLIKTEEAPRAEVIDGHQRLVTLTLLLAALVEKLSGDEAHSLAKYINEPGDLAEDRPPKPRLTPRERDQEFFHRYIQTESGLAKLLDLDGDNLTDPQKNIQANAKLYVKCLEKIDAQEAFALGKFIVNRCYLVAVSTPSMQSAYRIFSVLNDRGLDLLPCDILKSDIIGEIPEKQREHYTEKWEDAEENLGREAFNELFRHIRMIYQKAKAKTTELEAFREYVLSKETDHQRLVNDILVPYAEAYDIVTNSTYESSQDASGVNNMLKWLRRIDNLDWIPPAMLFMRLHRREVETLERFYRSLERLAASLFIRRTGINDRIERYAKVIQAIEGDEDLWAKGSPLMLTETAKRDTLNALDGDIYEVHKPVRTYVMLRLDSFLSDQAAMYNLNILTVEHVLPQTVPEDSEWAKVWPDISERWEWLHRIGNLVLLSRRKNTQASNLDFNEKKEKYFQNRAGVSSFAITTQVLAQDEWTPKIVESRQGELLEKFCEGWEL
ncbi:MAG: DUF262 domain-containing HNH endonuclease family protein [Dissulfurispiraceae bacterium]|jgi:hypothetical protein